MSGSTGIEWTDATLNPIVGCSVVSPGCTNCYAMKMAARIERMNGAKLPHYVGLTKASKGGAVWTGKLAMAGDDALLAPLKRRKPTTYFVNSMGDLFHEDVPDAWIDRVFAMMALAPQHKFQCLTKRSARMRVWANDPETPKRVTESAEHVATAAYGHHWLGALGNAGIGTAGSVVKWPLANCWLGVSAEDQVRADERIADLLATPAAVRFVSAEPLLGPISFRWSAWVDWGGEIARKGSVDQLDGLAKLDWIISGGESGRGARPMLAAWARSIRDQCAAAGVAFFHKQNGEFLPATDPYDGLPRDMTTGGPMVRVGKRRAGRLLDGVEHNAFPA